MSDARIAGNGQMDSRDAGFGILDSRSAGHPGILDIGGAGSGPLRHPLDLWITGPRPKSISLRIAGFLDSWKWIAGFPDRWKWIPGSPERCLTIPGFMDTGRPGFPGLPGGQVASIRGCLDSRPGGAYLNHGRWILRCAGPPDMRMRIAPDPRTAGEWARGISAVRGAADARTRGRGRSDAGPRGFRDTADARISGFLAPGWQASRVLQEDGSPGDGGTWILDCSAGGGHLALGRVHSLDSRRWIPGSPDQMIGGRM
eukprot:gene14004-biopygen9577